MICSPPHMALFGYSTMCAIPDQTVNRQMRFTHQRTKSRRPTSGSLRTFIAYVPLSRRRFDCSRTLVSCISRKEQFQERFYKKDPTNSQGKSIFSLFSIGKRNIGGGVGQRPNGSWRRTCRHERSAAYDCWSNLIAPRKVRKPTNCLRCTRWKNPTASSFACWRAPRSVSPVHVKPARALSAHIVEAFLCGAVQLLPLHRPLCPTDRLDAAATSYLAQAREPRAAPPSMYTDASL